MFVRAILIIFFTTAIIQSSQDVELNCKLKSADIYFVTVFCNFTNTQNEFNVVSKNSLSMKDMRDFHRPIVLEVNGRNKNYPTRIPENFGKMIHGTTHLTYTRTPLVFIERKDLVDMGPHLRRASFEFNEIDAIAGDTFHDQPNLASLFLSFNNLKILNADLLKFATKLLEFHAFTNRIEEIPRDFFAHSPLIKVIELQNNRLATVRWEWFDNNLELYDLKISQTQADATLIDLRKFKKLVWLHFTANRPGCQIATIVSADGGLGDVDKKRERRIQMCEEIFRQFCEGNN
jgi:hypothetical protein